LLADLGQNLRPQTLLCIGCEVSAANAWVKTMSLGNWIKQNPDLHKRPCIFILG
jgi:16S rRNA (cytidine1402-2'-O)-methyltransferase